MTLTESKPRLLDLFAGAGGAARGYQMAGFHVTGVDIVPQPRYAGDVFIQADALTFPLEGFDAIHASPPCQGYSNLAKGEHPRLIATTRERLIAASTPYIIENIADAKSHLRAPVRLCGSQFGLRVQRHRLFELHGFDAGMLPPCAHGINGRIRAYYGKKGWLVWTPAGAKVQKVGRKPLLRGSVDDALKDMGIGWMTWDELREAVPPRFTEWLGLSLLETLRAKVTA